MPFPPRGVHKPLETFQFRFEGWSQYPIASPRRFLRRPNCAGRGECSAGRRGGEKNLKNSALPWHENDSLLRRESPIGRTAFQRTRFSTGYRRPTMERMEHGQACRVGRAYLGSRKEGRRARGESGRGKARSGEGRRDPFQVDHSYTNYGNDRSIPSVDDGPGRGNATLSTTSNCSCNARHIFLLFWSALRRGKREHLCEMDHVPFLRGRFAGKRGFVFESVATFFLRIIFQEKTLFLVFNSTNYTNRT